MIEKTMMISVWIFCFGAFVAIGLGAFFQSETILGWGFVIAIIGVMLLLITLAIHIISEE